MCVLERGVPLPSWSPEAWRTSVSLSAQMKVAAREKTNNSWKILNGKKEVSPLERSQTPIRGDEGPRAGLSHRSALPTRARHIPKRIALVIQPVTGIVYTRARSDRARGGVVGGRGVRDSDKTKRRVIDIELKFLGGDKRDVARLGAPRRCFGGRRVVRASHVRVVRAARLAAVAARRE